MTKFLGAGGASVIASAILFVFGGSGEAFAQQVNKLPVVQAVVRGTTTASGVLEAAQQRATDDGQRIVPGSAGAIAREAGWLSQNGWPLYALVDKFSAGAPLTDQAHCIAVAVYHEARGESLEGQLAVARVIMNRAASGRYPNSWCAVVKQPWQFSFVRNGQFPSVDSGSAAWRKALGVTRLAVADAVPSLSNDVLWYHADYVAPGWGRRLTRVEKIGAHIFYRS